MMITRYTAWDGTQRVRLDANRIFERLSEFLSYTDDVQQALDSLLRQGIDREGLRVVGLDELLEAVREKIREAYRSFNLDHALDDVQRRFDELVEMERDGLDDDSPDPAERQRRRDALDDLPRSLSTAIQRLKSQGLEDEDARRELGYLLDQADEIRDVEEFQRRFGELFQGPKKLDFDEALELMNELKRWRDLEERIMAGDLGAIDAEEIGRILGERSQQDFRTLQQMMSLLQQSGYLASQGNRMQLSPKGVRRIGQLALRDIFEGLVRDRSGGHGTDHRGIHELRPGATRPYRYGDPMNLDLVATLKKSLARGPGVPLQIEPDDFEIQDSVLSVTTATVLLLDMSWSMSWEGRFAAAKKVALALESLIRARFPRDYFGIVGFYTRAVELKLKDLPEASWNMGDPFTNLQDGLRLASVLLDRHPSRNQQIIVVTDGQPTAYFSKGRLYCEWPLSFGGISMRAARETLKEVERVTRKGITINTFMLDDSPSLRAFVESMTRINKGRALYTRPDHLGDYLLVDYLGRRRKRI